jgi:NNP family nitrate/nitrite transporter-like MFS transporter
MTNINHYYPPGSCSASTPAAATSASRGQLVGLLVLATLGAQHPRALVVIYIPLIILSALGAT